VHDFRSFVELLEESGDLVRVKREVDRKYEMPAVISRLEKKGKAYLFENVKGSEMPVVGGLLNGSGRLALALQRPSPDAATLWSPLVEATSKDMTPASESTHTPTVQMFLHDRSSSLKSRPKEWLVQRSDLFPTRFQSNGCRRK